MDFEQLAKTENESERVNRTYDTSVRSPLSSPK